MPLKVKVKNLHSLRTVNLMRISTMKMFNKVSYVKKLSEKPLPNQEQLICSIKLPLLLSIISEHINAFPHCGMGLNIILQQQWGCSSHDL